jgi:mycofactocin precursor
MSIDTAVIDPAITAEVTAASAAAVAPETAEVEELLVEEVSIDGMCGVY